ncbi:hypothetical protein BDR07DRAFT_1494271 [Suillus spraguei]|nr:hypothetical protein BDR07DRAFT_1494271 [Suillus spraguei]
MFISRDVYRNCFASILDIYKVALLSRAEREGTAVDPIDIWAGVSHPSSPLRPLHSIAQPLLSICPNSASCKHLFSMFGAILTKWRNQPSTETLTLIAELKIELLNYSHAEEWLGSFYKTAIRGLDAELKLYKLLDLDAEGIEDSEFPQVDGVLAE